MAKIDDNSYTVFFNARHKSNANDSSEILMDNMVIREKKKVNAIIFIYISFRTKINSLMLEPGK